MFYLSKIMHAHWLSGDIMVMGLHGNGLSVQFSSVTWLCPTLCNSLDCSTPDFPVHPNSWSLFKLIQLRLELKPTFSSPVATAEFSTFAAILSAALSQDHILGFEIAQLEFHHLTSFVRSDAS